MEKMKWKEIPAGIINGATDRFWVALGDDAGLIANRINKDQRFVSDLATMAVTLCNGSREVAVKEDGKLLEFSYIFYASALEKFVAKEKFMAGKTIDCVGIYKFGENFKTHFLGKIEEDLSAVELKIHKLLEAARDLPKKNEPGIIPELGDKHEIALAHFFQLLSYKQQKKDFSWIVAYICDENAVLWAVNASWDSGGDGWYVEAFSVGNPYRWLAGNHVVSF